MCLLKVIPTQRPGGEIGRHTGLKILRELIPCRFDSGLGHYFYVYNLDGR